MQPAIETTAAQHVRNIPIFIQVLTSQTKIPFEIQHRNDGCRYDFGIRHLALRIFRMMQRFEHVIAQTKNNYNLSIHEFFPYFGGRDTPTVTETHGFFYSGYPS